MNKEFDLKGIAFFCAAGFFPDKDTYVLDETYSYPSTPFEKSFNNFSNFTWYSEPGNIGLDVATDKFAQILESIVDRIADNQQVILPLSGGLDSRTLAAALKRTGKKVTSYSYSFRNGHNENDYGEKISNVNKFYFNSLFVESGYLWDVIDRLAKLNHCYSEFTHPRQMAFVDQYSQMGDVFTLGHWGDVLFDDMKVADDLNYDQILLAIIKKIKKKGGIELANQLWTEWNLEGTFDEFFQERINQLLSRVYIDRNANATIRAFKSKYWATRWTASNFCIFENARPITVPYFDIEMCNFICTIPEKLLKGRQIQIAYLKKYAPKLAAISWQANRPFNLHNYTFNKIPWNIPYRITNKLNRIANSISGKHLIQRNWELQFLGETNQFKLENSLLKNNKFDQLIPEEITKQVMHDFYKVNTIQNAHPLSILLTISKYCKLFNEEN